ncbi:8-oxoguanine DNA glycosylase [Anaerococcus sp. AGMB00486]|uniref:DNA-(apurinic or apyrimidinic site) lyase n=2 Tax=Anaerococcus TaxID=165779 RepID=A0ABX2NBN2_9FIRM|nr:MULTISPECIES: DNA glycosylase [Anaerococcus]MDY3006621.1 DNA glycosylase [Anaerococcus porci]MSS78090.1 8-oxoguanine DNA glycosylase [Anaerococcus porci]NVF12106.1 8-oxoguanine DNA glycosylase [Anaerococcus faecalis]
MSRFKTDSKKKLNIREDKGQLILIHESFDPKDIFTCGQCFNFYEEDDGSFTAVFLSKIINLKSDGDKVIIDNISLDEFYDIFYDYFDLNTNYEKIKNYISIDETLKKATEYGAGIRILNQEFFETLISFIISANNQIPRIKKSVRIISKMYGDYIGEYRGRDYYSFPTAASLSKAKSEDLREFARVGFRDKRIVEAANIINDGYFDFEEDIKMKTPDLRKKLQELPGIGPKVADCILLFAFHKRETFPVDVWIKRVMEALFIKKEVPKKQISEYADKYFGENAGYVQQYLFYYGRENAIGK